MRWSTPLTLLGLFALTVSGNQLGASRDKDRDRDGLSDRLELQLAMQWLPVIHQYSLEGQVDACAEPTPRPVLVRVRPRVERGVRDAGHLALTYVLLYSRDCGGLGHDGDAEPFSVFLSRDPRTGEWHGMGAVAVAHQGTAFEQRSFGSGTAIWVSRNKHGNFATFDACGEQDGDICARSGVPPSAYTWLNVGEPDAPLSDEAGDVIAMFKGYSIWHHEAFFDAGDLTRLFFIDQPVRLTPDFDWPAEFSPLFRKDESR